MVPEDEEFKNAFEAMTKGNWVITALVSVAGLLFCNLIAENKKEKEFAELQRKAKKEAEAEERAEKRRKAEEDAVKREDEIELLCKKVKSVDLPHLTDEAIRKEYRG